MESLFGSVDQKLTYLLALERSLVQVNQAPGSPIYCLDKQARVVGMGLERLGKSVKYLNVGSEKFQPYVESLLYPDEIDSNLLMQQLPHLNLQHFIQIYGLEFNSVISLLKQNQAIPFIFDDFRGTGFTEAFTRRVFELAVIPEVRFITMQDLVEVDCFRERSGVFAGKLLMPWFNEIREIFQPSKPQDFFLELNPKSPVLTKFHQELATLI